MVVTARQRVSTTKGPGTRGCTSSGRLLDHPQQGGVQEGFLEEMPPESTQMRRAEPGDVGSSELTPCPPPPQPVANYSLCVSS